MPVLLLSLLVMLTTLLSTADAKLRVPSVLADNMVLQQQKPILLWGSGDPAVAITASLQDSTGQTIRSADTVADSAGHWLVTMPAMQASFTEYNIVIQQGQSKLQLSHVLIGEVWLAGGQSNMQLTVPNIIGGDKLIAEAHNPHIRNFCQDHMGGKPPYSKTPMQDVSGGRWLVADSAKGLTAGDVSGIGYSFALALFDALNTNGKQVPIAILNTATGSTSIQAWISPEKTHSDPILEKDFDKTWQSNQSPGFNFPTAMFNHKIAPLVNLQLRGFIWLQGENNVGDYDYESEMESLIADWREKFRDPAAPFIAAELAPYAFSGNFAGARLREAQIAACNASPPGCAIPIYDFPLTWNVGPFGYKHPIHPLDKIPVGRRMALAARSLAYAQSVEFQGPVFHDIKIDGPRAIVSFTQAGKGLKLIGDGDHLKGFAICAENRIFLPAQATITGNAVEVTSPDIQKPVAVTYAWADLNQDSNLGNEEGLPAQPFRSDTVASHYLVPMPWLDCDATDIWLATHTDAHTAPAWTSVKNPNAADAIFSIDPNPPGRTGRALHVDYTQKSADPLRVAFSPTLAKPLDFSHFSGIAVDVYNPGSIAATLKLSNQTNTLPPQQWSTVRFTFETTKKDVDQTRVQQLLFEFRPGHGLPSHNYFLLGGMRPF
jgi:sialate O-acetylesterase